MLFVIIAVVLCAFSTQGIADTVNPGGNLVAILASGDITDFGYSNSVNTGRIKMERTLNISGSLFASNIEDEASALEIIDQLAAQGYKLIISTTTAHVNAPIISAGKYPNISFVMSGGTSTLPNLSSLNWSGPDQYYAAGVFSGAITTTKKVGFIHPGPPLASIGTLNAFYVGVKSMDPDCEVLTVFTDSYLNPDRTTGAANILLNNGVDMLVGQQDDLTLQKLAISNGFLAVGTNGYSLRDIFGETVGVSVVRNWGGPFTTYAENALKGVYRKDISGAFASGYTTLDTPSHLVPSDVWTKVQAGVELLKGKTKPYYCTQLVAELGLNSSSNCLLNNTMFTSKRLDGINYLGTYHVPLEVVTFPKSDSVAIIVVSSIMYLITACVALAVLFYWRDTVMLASSPTFLCLVLVGVALCFTGTIVWVSEPNENVCAARVWLPSIGFTLCMGAMIIKNVRLVIIFDAQLRKVRIRDAKLIMWIALLLAVDIILLAVWDSVGDPSVIQQQAVEGLGTYQVRNICQTKQVGDHLLIAIICWHIALLAVGCVVTFKIRVIDIEEFNESRPFGLSIYVVSLVFTIAGILVGTGDTTNKQVITIVSLSLLIGASAILFLVFAPKFLTILLKGNRSLDNFLNTTMQQKNSSNKSVSKSRSGTSGGSGTSTNSVDTEMREKETTQSTKSINVMVI